MSVLEDYLVDPKLSLLDKTRIQAQVLVPVLRALRTELGKGKADTIVKQALRDWSKQLFAAIGSGVDGSPRRKWAAMHTAMAEITEHDVTVEMLCHDNEALEFDITHCQFAEFFRALGEPELGALLICETDFDIAAAAKSLSPATELSCKAHRAARSAISSRRDNYPRSHQRPNRQPVALRIANRDSCSTTAQSPGRARYRDHAGVL
jgi:hypothetical protein